MSFGDKLVFVSFDENKDEGADRKIFFVGNSMQDILKDTNGGKNFGFGTLSNPQSLTFEEVQELGFENLEIACEEAKKKHFAFYLGLRQGEKN